MEILQIILQNLFSFIAIISVVIFIHEYGHFYVARKCGVKVEEFSLGFGKKLFGFVDKKGTLWKICLLPFGGYVKMYGDKNAASIPDEILIKKMSKKEREISFIAKNVYKRMAIVIAGPVANFLLAIFLFASIFYFKGVVEVSPTISEIVEDSPAQKAGLKTGDEIVAINNRYVDDFGDVIMAVSTNTTKEMLFSIRRKSEIIDVKITPEIKIRKDFAGEEVKMPMIGVVASQSVHKELGLLQSARRATIETYDISVSVVKTLGQLIVGQRSIKELGGPIKIAKYSGKTFESKSKTMIIWFMALISINLGVLNLLPIPVLDGGHLFYYFVEAIRGRAISQPVQKIGYQLGFSLLITLMVFTTVNDIISVIK